MFNPSLTPSTMNSLWRVAGASVRGAGHQRSGDPCQDACAFRELPDGTLIMAVADGAGSARLAREAAQLQVQATCEFMERRLTDSIAAPALDQPRTLLEPALQHALQCILDAAVSARVEPRDLAATMLLLVAGMDRVCCAQIGDGAVVRAGSDQGFSALTTPFNGEYANETNFLVSPGVLDQAQYAAFHGAVHFLAMLSDGLQRLALVLPGGEPFAPLFSQFRHFMEQVPEFERRQAELEAFLLSEHVRSRADDDLTLVLALRP